MQAALLQPNASAVRRREHGTVACKRKKPAFALAKCGDSNTRAVHQNRKAHREEIRFWMLSDVG